MIEFDCDAENIGHIARHSVTTEDAEYLLTHSTLDLGMQDWPTDEDRFAEVGTTSRGRILVVVTTWRRAKIRVVTAYDPPREIAAAYLRNR